MSPDANKAVVQRLYDDLFNRGRLTVADELVTADCVSHAAPPGTPAGPDGLRQTLALLRAAFPDGRHVIEDLIGEDERVAVRLVFRGTHRGPFRDIAPTGRRVVQAQVHILRLAAGQVAEHWALQDDFGLLDQLLDQPKEQGQHHRSCDRAPGGLPRGAEKQRRHVMGNRHLAYRASLVCLMGGTIQIIYGLLAILFPYPRIVESQFEFLFLLANAGMIGGVVGLLALDVARPRALGAIGGGIAILGLSIRIAISVSLFLRPETPGNGSAIDAAIPASLMATFLGMGLLGIAALLGKRLPGWQASAPLLVVAFGIVTAAIYSIDKFVHFILLGLFWSLPWLFIGSVVFRHASNRDQVAPAPSAGSAATP